MAAAHGLVEELVRNPALSPNHHDLMHRTRDRLALVRRAFLSTGLDMHIGAADDTAPPDSMEVFESRIALCELSWRVRDIGRDLAIQLGTATASIGPAGSLIGMLCGVEEAVQEPLPA